MLNTLKKPPPLQVQNWLNTRFTPTLEALVGKVVVVFAFQMLCPGCVLHLIPQAKRLYDYFDSNEVAVLGLHTVFEHHQAMTEVSLKAFLYEYQVRFPVGIDKPASAKGDPLPQTMRAYNMQGTPTLLIYDKLGYLRQQKMGHEQDLALGAQIMSLMKET
ncbi:MAG: redoxin domain-containing protein [Oceanospirillaceae bacterium]